MFQELKASIAITDDHIGVLAQNQSLNFSREHREILKSLDSIDIQACPGSGKTTLIAAKLILLAQNWKFKHQGICVLSHTNVAKNEIIDRIKNFGGADAWRLLSYPNFIGTIQDFVDTFLALPYLRSNGISNFQLNDFEYIARAYWFINNKYEFSWLKGTMSGLGQGQERNVHSFLAKIYFRAEEEVNFEKNANAWNKPENLEKAQNCLLRLKEYLKNDGFFLFRDMFFYANKLIVDNSKVLDFMQKRFPVVLIDEMQDTQKHQDEILQKIFPLNSEEIVVQRFGDPDQAIFNGKNGEEPNQSYNAKPKMDFVIHQSHRFGNDIAQKSKNLSFNQVPLESGLDESKLQEYKNLHSQQKNFTHTIFIYDNSSIKQVIPEFAKLIATEFSSEYQQNNTLVIKVVGAIGNEIDETKDQLKIGHYWPRFDKRKSQKDFKADTLIEVVNHCRQSSKGDWVENYKCLNSAILELLRKADHKDSNDRFLTSLTLKDFLIQAGRWDLYRKIIYKLLDMNEKITQKRWVRFKSKCFKKLFGLATLNEDTEKYLEFIECSNNLIESSEQHCLKNFPVLPGNKIQFKDYSFQVELSTIHGVKGETHDATLVLATKYKKAVDLKKMLPYLITNAGQLQFDLGIESIQNKKRNIDDQDIKFMHQLYVAMTRPKHLLCMAIRSDHMTSELKVGLEDNGWNIVYLKKAEPS